MASTLAARQAANFLCLSAPRSASQAASLIQRRGLTGAAEHHGPKVDFWKDPFSPSRWKEEHFVIVSLTGWGVLIFGVTRMFS